MSLRAKLALALALLAGVATAAIGIASLRSTSETLYDEVDRSIEDATERWLHGGRFPDQGRRFPGEEYGERAEGPGIVAQVLDATGEPVASTDGTTLPVDGIDRAVASGEHPVQVRRDVDVDGVRYRMFTTPLTRAGGAIQTGRYLEETERILSRLRTRTAWAVVVVSATAALLGWLLAFGFTRRLTRLTAAAEEVATTGRLDVPVPGGGRDEAGRLAHAFNRMLEALGRSRDAQQRLVQDAGHELRTPLTSLRTNIDVLRRHGELPAVERARVVEDLEGEALELTDLVNELVDLATDRRAEEEPVPVALGDIARRVADRARRRTGRVVLVTADGTTVEGRPGMLERAIANLLDNAAKFDPSEAPIELDVRGGRVEVRDRGPGIAEEDLPLVFERFHRSVAARSLPGSGLGLAIVKDVAEAHGGTAFAQPRPGGGSVVGFTVVPTLL